jgi:hypothetical protein
LEYTKQVQESDEEFIFRVCKDKESIGSWQDVADILNKELKTEYTESKFRKSYQAYMRMFEATKSQHFDKSYIQQLDQKEDILYKERTKNNDKIRELRSDLRQEAREEYFWELLSDGISKLKPLQIPKFKIEEKTTDTSPILLISDQHYGTEFQINGLEFGEILNEYSISIFERRMWNLLEKTIVFLEKENYKHLDVFSLGDELDGMIRIGQLMSLKYGVVDSCLMYADFMSNWLNELSKMIHVRYFSTAGNHTMLRLLDNKKESFPNENMQKVIDRFIELQTKNNPNLTVCKNNTDKIFTKIQGSNILGIHGEEKSAEQALKDFSNIYGKELNYIFYGHKHHSHSETVGFCKGTIGVGSIMGTDDFAIRIKTASNPSATYCIFENSHGKVQENIINL